MLAFIHYLKTKNAGDLYSGPYRYFDFGKHKVVDLRDLGRCKLIGYRGAVFGGGAIAHNIPRFKAFSSIDAPKRIAWGFGRTFKRANVEEYSKPGSYPGGFDLVGIRDAINPMPGEAEFVPCVSCMHAALDDNYETTRKFSGFFNAERAIPNIGFKPADVMLNNAPIEKILCHLASAETVVTNSYHGAYWAALLGRGVIVLNPYSSKFYQMPFPVAHAFVRSVKELKVIEGLGTRVLLENCRRINQAFYRKALRVLND